MGVYYQDTHFHDTMVVLVPTHVPFRELDIKHISFKVLMPSQAPSPPTTFTYFYCPFDHTFSLADFY